MAVYTNIEAKEAEQFLSNYDIGTLRSLKGIAEGVENSNYLLVTSQGQFILTLYEKRVEKKDLPFFLGLMEHLAEHGFASPRPIKMRDGEMLSVLNGKSAAIIEFIEGVSVSNPDVGQCEMMGAAAAKLHAAAKGFTIKRKNALGQHAWRKQYERFGIGADSVKAGLCEFIKKELDFQDSSWPQDLPGGVIHADLFPDNVFFLDGKISGVIDYYFSANDYWALDIATCINAWCFDKSGEFYIEKSAALIKGYQSVRKLEVEELEALPIMCRGSALRFLLTRLYDWLNVPTGALVVPHNPHDYVARLQFHQTITSSAQYGAVMT